MQKKLVRTELALVEYFLEEIGTEFSIEAVESALGIEFAYNSGAFPSDGKPSEEDDGTVNENIWKNRKETRFPKEYPAIICWVIDLPNRMRFDYIYPSDFNKKD